MYFFFQSQISICVFSHLLTVCHRLTFTPQTYIHATSTAGMFCFISLSSPLKIVRGFSLSSLVCKLHDTDFKQQLLNIMDCFASVPIMKQSFFFFLMKIHGNKLFSVFLCDLSSVTVPLNFITQGIIKMTWHHQVCEKYL